VVQVALRGRVVLVAHAIIALCMALDRLKDQPAPTRLLGWLGPKGFVEAS